MKCKKCGAEITVGKLYCSKCGAEVQLVPDYNFLEDDMLSDIVQQGVRGTDGREKKDASSPAKKHSGKKKVYLIVGLSCFILLAGGLLAVYIRAGLEEKRYNSYDYQFEKGSDFLAQKEYKEALPYLKRAEELQPGDKDSANALLTCYLALKEETEAENLLQEMIRQDSDDREAYEQLIELYAGQKDYEKIHTLCKQVKDPDLLDLFEDYLVDQPSFSRISGTYHHNIAIQLSCHKGYDIFYTLDGRDPETYGIRYTGEIHLDKEGSTTITAVSRNEKDIYSEIVKATYTIAYEAPSAPGVTPAAGTYSDPQMVTISVPSGCTAYYTWDGTDPTSASAVYTEPMAMPEGDSILSVVAIDRETHLKSRIYRVNYSYTVQ